MLQGESEKLNVIDTRVTRFPPPTSAPLPQLLFQRPTVGGVAAAAAALVLFSFVVLENTSSEAQP